VPEYLAPGVYVEEVDTGPLPIVGVGTSTAGFVGVTKRGPTTGLPELVTSFADYQRRFGGHFADGALAGHTLLSYAVEGFFVNGGQRVYIKRVQGQGGVAAGVNAQGGLVTRLVADAPQGATKVRLATLRHVEVGVQLKLTQVKDGVVTESPAIPVTAYDRSTNEVTFANANALTALFESRYTVVTTTTVAITRANTFRVDAADQGKWGDEIIVRTEHASGASSPVVAYTTTAPPKVTLRSGAGFYVGAYVEFDRGLHKFFRKILARDGLVVTLDGALFAAGDLSPELVGPPIPPTIATVCEFSLSASYGGVDEQFTGLTLENVPGHYFKTIIDNGSTLITVGPPLGSTTPLSFPMGDDGLRTLLAGGNNGNPPNPTDYIGVDSGAGNRTGLQAMVDIDEVAILAIPGRTEQAVQSALISQCELLKDRFAILDPAGKLNLQLIQDQRSQFDTKYAAIYHPRLVVLDALTNTDIVVPPSGHVAGIYARTDVERGVHKAPANVVIRGITGLEQNITRGEQEILNPRNINVLRDLRSQGRGYRVWGARCMTSNPMWKYVPVRRLFIFLEESLDEGTQTFVFEPNDERLWPRVRQSISNFLSQVWRDGALMGTKPSEAYFVQCDRSTMSQQDIETGRLIVIVGVAPVFPAEFVIIRISQWSGGSSVEEL